MKSTNFDEYYRFTCMNMKTPVYFLLLLLWLLGACSSRSQSSASQEIAATEASVDSVEKATAIFWVDKRSRPPGVSATHVRTAKALVNIKESGKVDLLEFTKPQPNSVVKYLAYRLEIFRVNQLMLDSGYVKTGEQYVQLRYLPELADKLKQ